MDLSVRWLVLFIPVRRPTRVIVAPLGTSLVRATGTYKSYSSPLFNDLLNNTRCIQSRRLRNGQIAHPPAAAPAALYIHPTSLPV